MSNTTHTIKFSSAGFPGCCGIRSIVGLSTVPIGEKWKKENWDNVCTDYNNNTLIATTTEEQANVNKLLEAEGWIKQELPANPNTGNLLFLWIYTKTVLIEYEEPDENYDYDEEDEEY